MLFFDHFSVKIEFFDFNVFKSILCIKFLLTSEICYVSIKNGQKKLFLHSLKYSQFCLIFLNMSNTAHTSNVYVNSLVTHLIILVVVIVCPF